MKKLYVVRHAKSSWDDTEVADFDRPLNERGKRDAPVMAERLKANGVQPDLLVSSDARRAFSTAKRFGAAFGYSKHKIKKERRLYHASEEMILEIIRSLPDSAETAMVFGHNPGLTDFVNELSIDGDVTDNIPTAGVVAFEVPVASWQDINFQMGRMVRFDYPKNSA
jgi:phosphohistidine phosphatase